jgi:hypothetical protein
MKKLKAESTDSAFFVGYNFDFNQVSLIDGRLKPCIKSKSAAIFI